ncbi:MAG: hypothetical protein COA43_05540 [Robiginitomaculum sp.]|nr:MAG: hypothetical protein COA43_05540 [Robiginitomaculum sp.]
MDMAEQLATKAVRSTFNLTDKFQVSVQPHSATQANHVIWNAFLSQRDTIMGFHTTHYNLYTIDR